VDTQEKHMNESELNAALRGDVKENVEAFIVQQPTGEVVSVDWMESPVPD